MAMADMAAPGGGPDLPVWGQVAFTAVAIVLGVVILVHLWRNRGRNRY